MRTKSSELKNKQKTSYLEFYQEVISPRLREIDLHLKTTSNFLEPETVAKLLDLTLDETVEIMEAENLKFLDRSGFFQIMYNGSSEICGLYRRELDCGSPYIYTRLNISYIYNIDLSIVNEVCDNLRIKEATAFTLPEIFAQIEIWQAEKNNCSI